jgi:pimeloyl-ACP methyl ester carboxylesterase
MLHYERLGHGPHILLAFHGVCQTGRECFLPFANYLGTYYTLYAFDLFHHGKSADGDRAFSERDAVTKGLWKNLLQDFLNENNIQRFDVAGFSIGGRFALATAEAFPGKIDRLLLIAPDGVVEHPLYQIATRFGPTRWLYRKIIHRPQPLFSVADLCQKAGLVPQSTVRFVRHILASPHNRRVIYRSWVGFRKLSFSMPALYSSLQAYQVTVWLFAGKYDSVLPPARLKALSDLLPRGQLVILETGHTQLVEKTALHLSRTLK